MAARTSSYERHHLELTRKTGILPDDLARIVSPTRRERPPASFATGRMSWSFCTRPESQIISDHYSHWTRWPLHRRTTVLEFLDSLLAVGLAETGAQPADWGWDGVFVYLRTRDVLAADSAETPNRLLRPWASCTSRRAALELDEHADIAVLSPDQTMVLGQFGQYLGLGDQIDGVVRNPQLFGALSTAQRREARSGVTSVDAFTSQRRRSWPGCSSVQERRFHQQRRW